jgi:hypothetical protein
MHNFIDRVGRAPLAIVAGSLVIGAGILGVHAAASDNSGVDNTSPEYQQGWNQAVEDNLSTGDLKVAEEICVLPALYDTAAKADAVRTHYSEVHFKDWSYNDHQRKEWAHGCLDALRNFTDYKVPQQSWEG